MTRDGNVTLKPGVTLFEYRIDSVLGQGGFGITYKATDLQLNRTVAIKEYFPREFSHRDLHTARVVAHGNEEDRETFEWGLKRFLAEARTLARFHHPSIVAIRRFFEFNDTAYIVMDFAEGRSLSEILKEKGSLPWSDVKSFLPSLLDGLAIVHKAGVLHRDIKPANIYLRHDGTPILLDFGSASLEIVQHSRSVTSIASAGYGAVEQYSTHGKQAEYTDIYGLAATLYHVVTGKKPQDAPDRILDDKLEPASKVCRGKYPASFLGAIDIGLNVRPESRPNDISTWRIQLLSDMENASPRATFVPNTKKNNQESSLHLFAKKLKKKKIKEYSFQAIVIIAVFAWIIFLFSNKDQQEQISSSDNEIVVPAGSNNIQNNDSGSESETANNKELEIPIKQGMPYLQGRKLLIDAGWQVVRAYSLPNGTPLCYLVAGDRSLTHQDNPNCEFIEIDACSGTGMGYCKMTFYDGKNTYLTIVTTGGDPYYSDGSINNLTIIDRWFKEVEFETKIIGFDQIESPPKAQNDEPKVGYSENYLALTKNEQIIITEMKKTSISQINRSKAFESVYTKPCPNNISADWDECFGERKCENGDLWRGDWKKNKANGIGLLVGDGNHYVGSVVNCEIEGHGKYFVSSGDIVVGELTRKESGGRVKIYVADGNVIEGRMIIENNNLKRIDNYDSETDNPFRDFFKSIWPGLQQ